MPGWVHAVAAIGITLMAVGLNLVVWAQAPPKAPAGPLEAAQWRAYATLLEGDIREKTRATALCTVTNEGLRAELERLQKRIAELETPK